MAGNQTSYGNIFKTTFLFGFVQIFNIAVKVILNKIVAIILGAEGMGIIGIYNSAINLLKTGTGLGINQSAVRDISEANNSESNVEISRIISLTNNVIIYTAGLGIIVTVLFSPFLSTTYFGDYSYILAFIWLSFVVGINVLSDGQIAILKGMRQMRAMAYASIYGSVVGLFAAVPFYYFFGKGGIIPSLIITSLASLLLSNYYVRKINYQKITFSLIETLSQSKPMIKMGVALMLVGFIGSVFDMIIAAFLSRTGSISDVGLYNAGAAIITSYFGIVITAMSTDYYPRISAVHNDNNKLTDEMNKQSETGLIMIFPLVVLFVFLSPLFIKILYTDEFYATNNYTDYAMIGTIITIVSNCMGMILLAKQASNIFVWSVLSQRIILLGIYLLLYHYLGLLGLGISYIILGLVHLIFMICILHKFYKIHLFKNTYILLGFIILITVLTILSRKVDIVCVKYFLGAILFFFSCIFSMIYMKKRMNLDIINIIHKKIKR
ncbi:MAG: oligosaccharide flippase family protein [Bacteroides sp.]|nr:oligosaccharide flippase family protein [Bacteroides sp.]